MVDLSSMALVMKDVEDIPTLRPLSDLFLSRRCFDGTRWTIWVCLKIVYPENPMVNDHYPYSMAVIGGIAHFQTYPHGTIWEHR